jgi:hypothetical protein
MSARGPTTAPAIQVLDGVLLVDATVVDGWAVVVEAEDVDGVDEAVTKDEDSKTPGTKLELDTSTFDELLGLFFTRNAESTEKSGVTSPFKPTADLK